MQKIPTLFKRADKGGGVIDFVNPELKDVYLGSLAATEKLDGTNVRVTVRNGTLVRLEQRRNPTKRQKETGIIEPWYVDAEPRDGGGKHIWRAAESTDLSEIEDGEWPGEAIGPGIQGNPLDLDEPTIVLFSLGHAPIVRGCPTEFDVLRDWLPHRMSALNPDRPIEGIVWWDGHRPVCKIKAKDFR